MVMRSHQCVKIFNFSYEVILFIVLQEHDLFGQSESILYRQRSTDSVDDQRVCFRNKLWKIKIKSLGVKGCKHMNQG